MGCLRNSAVLKIQRFGRKEHQRGRFSLSKSESMYISRNETTQISGLNPSNRQKSTDELYHF
jgi:hypothetical protein